MGDEGLIVRAAINKQTPALAERLQMVAPEGITFPEFMKLYDEQTYRKYCGTIAHPKSSCLRFLAQDGNMRGIKTAINNGRKEWMLGLKGAAAGGHLDLIDFFLQNTIDWNPIISVAITKGQKEIVEVCVERQLQKNDCVNWEEHFHDAVISGSTELVDYFINYGKKLGEWDDDYYWNTALTLAVEMSLVSMVEHLIELGAEPWGGLLFTAAEGENKEVIDLLIDYGLRDWNSGLLGAVESDNVELVKFFLTKGATDVQGARDRAVEIGSTNVAKYLQ